MSRMSYIDEVNEVIDRHGFSITYVGDTCACNADHCVPPNIPWGYTVGVLDRGFPELVMTGLQPIPTAELFHTVWDLVCASLLPRIGRDHAVVIDGVTVCFVPIPDSYWDETDLLLGAAEYHAHYGTPRRAVQMVVADNDGRFPWNDAFDPAFRSTQPVLADMPPARWAAHQSRSVRNTPS